MRTPRRADRVTSWVRRLLAASIVTTLAGPVHAQTSESVEYYATDAVGSVRVVFDASGNILGRMDYAPFGGELFSGQNMPSQRFAGLFRDGEAGLDYAQARPYQVRTGRFNAPDPVYAGMFDPQQWNRYTYTNNNPVSFVDPEGLNARNPALCTPEIQRLNPNDFHCQPDYSLLPGAEFGLLMWRNNYVQLDMTNYPVAVVVVTPPGAVVPGQVPPPVVPPPTTPPPPPPPQPRPGTTAPPEPTSSIRPRIRTIGSLFGGLAIKGAAERLDCGRPRALLHAASAALEVSGAAQAAGLSIASGIATVTTSPTFWGAAAGTASTLTFAGLAWAGANEGSRQISEVQRNWSGCAGR